VAYKTQFVRTLDKKGGGGNFASGKNAVGICHRSGFKFPYSELVFEPGTNFLVHKSENDGSYSVVNHPQNYPPSSDKLVDKIGLKWAFTDVPLSLGTVVSASDFFRIDSLTTNVGIHLDFRTNHYYSRTSSGATNEANFATFANFNRNSIATYMGPDGLIKYAGPNEPRIEYSPTGEFLGYLVETSAANLILQNTALSVSPWAYFNVSVATNAYVAPDGTRTADAVIAVSTATSSVHPIFQAFNTVLSAPYTASFFVKPLNGNGLYLQLKDQAVGNQGFDLTLDLAPVSVISNNPLGTGTVIKTSVTQYPDGWILVQSTGTFGTTATANLFTVFPLAANREVAYIANGTTEAFALWGVQVEQSKHRTSMIPTTTAIGTRPRDRARVLMPPTIYSSVAGTMAVQFVDAVASVTGTNQFRTYLSDLSYTNSIAIGEQNGREGFSVNANGGFNGNATVSVKTVPNQVTKMASSWSDNNVVAARNGQEIVVDAVASVPTGFLSAIQIGSDHNGFNNCIRTHIQKIDYWPYQKTNQELVALSSVG
jgi:hypothetical protein